MSTQQQITGNWNQLKGKVKQRWGQLTDDELQEVEGNYDQLIGLIQQKTGEARQHIEGVLSDIGEQAGGAFSQASDAAREYVDQAAEMFRGSADEWREKAMHGYEDAQNMIRQRPAESIAVAFGAGLLLGVIVGMVACSRD
jgi:uncharacterized protein YjbJ (UPF0337 family)